MARTSPSDAYRQRIERALAFVAANLHRPIRLSEVAAAAAFSEYHFHRIFRSLMDETVGQFITRQRMERAALMLAYHDDRSITDIGFSVGYSSTANFSKAFSAYFGVSPSRVRAPDEECPPRIGTLKRRFGFDFRPSDLYRVPNQQDAEARLAKISSRVRYENREGFSVVCLSSEHGYDVAAGMELWANLITRVQQLGLCGEDIDSYGIVHDDPAITAGDRCRYAASVRVESIELPLPPPLYSAEVPSGRFAIIPYEGQIDELALAYRDIYALWFPSTALAPAHFASLEHYINDGPSPTGYVEMELLFSVRPLHARDLAGHARGAPP